MEEFVEYRLRKSEINILIENTKCNMNMYGVLTCQAEAMLCQVQTEKV